ncbi:MAG: exo-alpha-sialidase [Candidatus Aminicenantes bacterium]|nr:MAG: exo-alpha-sialidase [Candidatus Aminicenantes bacterium]
MSPIYVMALHKTTDGGNNWTSRKITSGEGIGNAVAVASRNKNIIYVGGTRGTVGALYKSTDGGQTWTELGKSFFNVQFNQVNDIEIDPGVNNRVYVGCENGLFKSTDGGITWNKKYSNSINDILINPFATNKIYAGGYFGIIYSSDRGNNWTDISTELAVKDTLCLDMNPTSDILYVGSNGGSVFQKGILGGYSLVIKAEEGGTTEPKPGSYVHEEGERVTIQAIPDSYHVFSGWTGSVTNQENPITLTMDNDKTITANFKTAVLPPVSVSGEKVTNRSLMLVQSINVLRWQANPQNTGIAKYRIYLSQDNTLQQLGEVEANTLFYWHRDVEKDEEHTYGVCAVNDTGQESEPAFVTIR